MYLGRSTKPLKPFKPGARGIVSDKAPTYSGAAPPQQGVAKQDKIRVPGKNVSKRKQRLPPPTGGAPAPVEPEYDVVAVKSFMDRQGAAEPQAPVAPAPTPTPVKSNKIGLPKKVGGLSSRIQPRVATTAKTVPPAAAPVPAPIPPVKKVDSPRKKQKDDKLLNQLMTTVEPDDDDSDLLKDALDGEYSESEASEVVVDDDDLMSE